MARLTLEGLGLDQGLRAMVLKVTLEMRGAPARVAPSRTFNSHPPCYESNEM